MSSTQDEQLEKFKAWWKQNGTPVISGAAVAFVLIAGYNWWDGRQQHRNEASSDLYAEMLDYLEEEEFELAVDAGRRLVEEYGGTDYAGQGAQVLARIAIQDEDWDEAQERLQWVVDNHDKPATVHTARLRLARLLLDRGELENAETLVTTPDRGGFDSHYLELQGDVLMMRGEKKLARTRYANALERIPRDSSYRELLLLKIQDTADEDS